MQNEEKIIELLTESLQRQDGQAELLGKQLNVLGEHTGQLKFQAETLRGIHQTLQLHGDMFTDHIRLIGRLEDQLSRLNKKMDKLLDFEDRIKSLEAAVFKKGA